jgi:import receptor subunit TOM70
MLGRHEQAMADIEKAIEIDPDFLLAYVNRAAYYLNLDRVGEAEEELKYVLDHEPDDSTRKLAEQYLAMCQERNEK